MQTYTFKSCNMYMKIYENALHMLIEEMRCFFMIMQDHIHVGKKYWIRDAVFYSIHHIHQTSRFHLFFFVLYKMLWMTKFYQFVFLVY